MISLSRPLVTPSRRLTASLAGGRGGDVEQPGGFLAVEGDGCRGSAAGDGRTRVGQVEPGTQLREKFGQTVALAHDGTARRCRRPKYASWRLNRRSGHTFGDGGPASRQFAGLRLSGGHASGIRSSGLYPSARRFRATRARAIELAVSAQSVASDRSALISRSRPTANRSSSRNWVSSRARMASGWPSRSQASAARAIAAVPHGVPRSSTVRSSIRSDLGF